MSYFVIEKDSIKGLLSLGVALTVKPNLNITVLTSNKIHISNVFRKKTKDIVMEIPVTDLDLRVTLKDVLYS